MGRALVRSGFEMLTDAPLHVLRCLLLHPQTPARTASPADVRQFLDARARAGFVPAALPHPLLPGVASPDCVAALLRFCLQDLDAASAGAVRGLPLLLTVDGLLRRCGDATVASPSVPRLARLFARAPHAVAHPAVAAVVRDAGFSLQAAGVVSLTLASLGELLPLVLPASLATDSPQPLPPNIPLAALADIVDAVLDLAAPGAPAAQALPPAWALLAVHVGEDSPQPSLLLPPRSFGSVVALPPARSDWDPLARIVARLGVPYVCGSRLAFPAPTVLTLVRAAQPLAWHAASSDDRRSVLSLLEACAVAGALTPTDLSAIATLPLFELEADETTFAAISPSAPGAPPPRMLPPGVTLEGRFFRSVAAVAPQLYARLGVATLSVAEMYLHHILPAFPRLAPPARVAQMERLARLFDSLGSDTATVAAAASASCFLIFMRALC